MMLNFHLEFSMSIYAMCFLKFKFPFVGIEKTFYVQYVACSFLSRQLCFVCLKGLMHDCNKAVMLYMQRMAGCLFAYIKHVGTRDVHAMCYVKRDLASITLIRWIH